MKFIAVTIGFSALVAYAGWIFLQGIDRDEQRECYQWQSEARDIRGYYLTAWQKEQCDHWKIRIEAI